MLFPGQSLHNALRKPHSFFQDLASSCVEQVSRNGRDVLADCYSECQWTSKYIRKMLEGEIISVGGQ